ncbi:MAG: MipA/OmpV family protein [Deltaproteobacteria bacterium]|nr:MipA/OmpV family protein [Deltaproteobacteria bacterium]
MNHLSRSLMVVLVAVLLGTALSGSSVLAEELKVSVDAEVLAVSKYVWRGLEVNEDPVLQPSLTVAYGGFSFNLWGNMDLTDFGEDECVYTSDCKSRAGQFTEIDLTLDYSHSFDKFTLGAGIISYQFPNWDESEDTHEVYLAFSYDCLLAPALTLYYDFDEVDGFYANFSIGHSFALSEKVGLDLSASLGYGDSDYNAAYFGVDESALVDANGSIALPFQVSDKITITPILSLSTVVDSDLRDSVKSNSCCDHETNLYGGISIAMSF